MFQLVWFVFFGARSFGGILGWDPVLTTCILVREDNSQDITEMHKGPHHSHRVDHEKNCEAIYWKHHTSHHLTKNSHTITFKTLFFNKIIILIKHKQNSLSKHSKIILTVFSSYFKTSLKKNTCSVYRIPPQNTPRKTEKSKKKIKN